jgi:hypothetical protein
VENSDQKRAHKLLENNPEVGLEENSGYFEDFDLDIADYVCASNL